MDTISRAYELSPVQKRIWNRRSLTGTSLHKITLTFTGAPDITRINEYMDMLAARHEILQMDFLWKEELKYPLLVHAGQKKYPVRMAGEQADQEAVPQLQVFLKPEAHQFDLSFIASPMVADMHSLFMLANDFSWMYVNRQQAGYSGEKEEIGYTQFSGWLTNLHESPDEDAAGFWNTLCGKISSQKMPFDKEPEHTAGAGFGVFTTTIDEALVRACRRLAAEQQTSTAILLLSAYSLQLMKYAGARNCYIGCGVINRLEELRHTFGPVSIIVPLCIEGDPDGTFSTFVSSVQNAWEQVNEFREYYNPSAAAKEPELSLGYEYFNTSDSSLPPGVTCPNHQIISAHSEYYSMRLTVVESKESIQLNFYYDEQIYDQQQVEWISRTYLKSLHNLVMKSQKALSCIDWSDPLFYETIDNRQEAFPEGTIPELFRAASRLHGSKTALIFKEDKVTYQDLDQQSNQLAQLLTSQYGIGKGLRVGILLPRSADMIVAMLAVLKAGAAYVPVDTTYPADRIAFILEDALLSLLITTEEQGRHFKSENPPLFYSEDFQTAHVRGDERATVHAQDIAYIIYTSGTTGKPKGTCISHGSIGNTLQWRRAYYGFNTNDIMLQLPSAAFDSSVEDIFTALLSGATLVIPEETRKNDLAYLKQLCVAYPITHFLIVPSFYRLILESIPASLLHLRVVTVAGEALTRSLCELHFNRLPGVRLVNEYGPTENAVCTTAAEILQGRYPVVIGKPLPGVKCFIVNGEGEPVSPGIAGELCIAGAGLAQEYWQRPQLTEEKFPVNLIRNAGRTYRTGDSCYWLPDGNIVFLGRIDHQVKIRGNRVEPAEVSAVMEQMPGIEAAVVKAYKDGKDNDELKLAAFYQGNRAPDDLQWRLFLQQHLPKYMIPACFIALEKLPVTPNGKIDVNALPDPNIVLEQLTRKEIVLPRNEKEKLLVALWSAVLKKEDISVFDNFYSIGGDSIKAIQITARVYDLGFKMEVKDIFKFPFIHQLAERMEETTEKADQGKVLGPVRLTPIQHYFFNQVQIDRHHYNQSVLLQMNTSVHREIYQQVFNYIWDHHDMLRAAYHFSGPDTIIQECRSDIGGPDFSFITLDEEKDLAAELERISNTLQVAFSLEKGPLGKVAVCSHRKTDYILIIIHHLVIDGISWRILLRDLNTLLQQHFNRQELQLPGKTLSYQQYANRLTEYASNITAEEKAYWSAFENIDRLNSLISTQAAGLVSQRRQRSFSISIQGIEAWKNGRTGKQVERVLLAALSLSLKATFGKNEWPVMIEYNGRDILDDCNVSATVGWFTVLYPLMLKAGNSHEDTAQHIVSEMAAIPAKGIGYGLLNYEPGGAVRKDASLQLPVIFNYLGEWNVFADTVFKIAAYSLGQQQSPAQQLEYALDISALLVNEKLEVTIGFDSSRISPETGDLICKNYQQYLQGDAIDRYNLVADHTAYTYDRLSKEEIDSIFE